ncbi:hypothetical protein L873DRAFT_1800155 [Choiromyces venosus 120613-1]|uniref:AAA-ATPase-like domain-containing protein n=1 Tax=Choiromyces venosus 120613-1 TaxID=1336337 RepID=A0A3N4K5H2_9PEZI|nr:hypothetical protein L873DRAFT_1800155 [Choiromyces venosus 120613-1]
MVQLTANARGLSTARLLPQKQQKSSLRIASDTIEAFPRCSVSNFSKLRANKRFAYFDRTKYVPVLDSIDADVILFLRPRRFGKSLTLSMLEHFHGVEHRAQYGELFKDLDVDKDVKENRVTPGQYLILKFNFAEVRRTRDLNEAAQGLADNIIWSLKRFYGDYYPYLGGSLDQLISKKINQGDAIDSLRNLVEIVNLTLREVKNGGDTKHPLTNVKGIYLLADEYDAFSNEYMDPHNSQAWAGSDASSLVKDFWATVKGMVDLPYGICRCFITGISPLSLADNTSGFNIAVNMSFKEGVAGLCGLSRADVEETLERICESKTDVEGHLARLTKYANGYHFCNYRKSEPVFNTDTSLEYLQAVLTGEDFNIASPPNSEVSPQFLEICASSPGAVTHIQNALTPSPDGTTPYHLIPYSKLVDRFTLADLQGSALGYGEEVAWHTLLLYFGAFTFDKENPSKFLTIPNHIAATRFSTTILRRFGLLDSMRDAVRFLALHGDIIAPLSGYRKLMAGRDIKPGGYAMTEWQHRDSFHMAILENPGLDPQVEYEVTKPGGGLGLVDLVLTSPGHCVVTEWKTVKIDSLDLGDSLSLDEKAEALSKLRISEVLDLEFHEREKYKEETIGDWIEEDVTAQLKSYLLSPEIRELARSREFHAYLVLVIGSRKILVWEMDEKGDRIGEPVLA